MAGQWPSIVRSRQDMLSGPFSPVQGDGETHRANDPELRRPGVVAGIGSLDRASKDASRAAFPAYTSAHVPRHHNPSPRSPSSPVSPHNTHLVPSLLTSLSDLVLHNLCRSCSYSKELLPSYTPTPAAPPTIPAVIIDVFVLLHWHTRSL